MSGIVLYNRSAVDDKDFKDFLYKMYHLCISVSLYCTVKKISSLMEKENQRNI
jgi:hypothetical protein